eukprot:TRINITY_DN20368_c0_g1_i1.p1 TRINITY_DN20368_c0_g1~~TRINITY_DN20368_c0_g1_i1.p1  ORF type:complete len:343 (-),score=63.18 TRINITY_DN20368_c0_g1_i1:17-979(-)
MTGKSAVHASAMIRDYVLSVLGCCPASPEDTLLAVVRSHDGLGAPRGLDRDCSRPLQKACKGCFATDAETSAFVNVMSTNGTPVHVGVGMEEEVEEDPSHKPFVTEREDEEEEEDEVVELTVGNMGGEELCRVRACIGKGGWGVPDLRAAIEAATEIPVFQQRLIAHDVELPFRHAGPLLHAVLPAGCTDILLIPFSEVQAGWIEKIVRQGVHTFASAPLEVRGDPDLALFAMRVNPATLNYLPNELLMDHQWLLAILSENPSVVQHASASMKTSKEWLLACAQARAEGKIGRQAEFRFGRLPAYGDACEGGHDIVAPRS